MESVEKVVFTIAPVAISVVAIIGGVALAIVRTMGQQRIVELERRERTAAIERGLEPATIPAPTASGSFEPGIGWGSRARRAHGLLIAGLVTVAVGVALMILLSVVESNDHWASGFLPLSVGIALLVSARITWPKGQE